MSYTDNDYSNPALFMMVLTKIPDETKIDWQPKTPMLYDVMSLKKPMALQLKFRRRYCLYIYS